MNINKKLDRVKQWAGEKMGQEAKTSVSDEFKALEIEMALRHEGRSAIGIWDHANHHRNGETAQVDDYLRQVLIQAQRR